MDDARGSGKGDVVAGASCAGGYPGLATRWRGRGTLLCGGEGRSTTVCGSVRHRAVVGKASFDDGEVGWRCGGSACGSGGWFGTTSVTSRCSAPWGQRRDVTILAEGQVVLGESRAHRRYWSGSARMQMGVEG